MKKKFLVRHDSAIKRNTALRNVITNTTNVKKEAPKRKIEEEYCVYGWPTGRIVLVAA